MFLCNVVNLNVWLFFLIILLNVSLRLLLLAVGIDVLFRPLCSLLRLRELHFTDVRMPRNAADCTCRNFVQHCIVHKICELLSGGSNCIQKGT